MEHAGHGATRVLSVAVRRAGEPSRLATGPRERDRVKTDCDLPAPGEVGRVADGVTRHCGATVSTVPQSSAVVNVNCAAPPATRRLVVADGRRPELAA